MKKITILGLLIACIIAFNLLNNAFSKPQKLQFHTEEEIVMLRDPKHRAPIQPGEYFLLSTSCNGCHGYDSAGVANVNESLEDVNLSDRWSSSMMAMSAKDPLWRAKVSQEILMNPAHAHELQNKCTSCHAPMGRYTAMFHGNPNFTMEDLDHDSLGLDGVSCTACHKISPNTGHSFSGNILYDTTHTIYGPFTAPFVAPMQLYEGMTPTFSPHMDNSKLCSSCHTLITQTADLSGNLTGGEFIEQATYHEYLNSIYPSQNKKCQTCHMPQLLDPIIIANGFQGLVPRAPFNQHTFAGANAFMVKLIKANRDSLNVRVPEAKFDSTIVATLDMLQHKTINLNLTVENITQDTAYFKVKIENKSGHKFPSGYPARRAVVQFIATDSNNDTVFKSGVFAPNFRVIGETPAYEPHRDVITQSGTSQIYEMVMGDVNSNFTSVLERASVLLKDNRIPPKGFTTNHAVYDTTKISSDALADDNFNKQNSVQGTGIDYVYYNVPLAGISGTLSIKAKVYYQSVPPKFLDEMFALSSYPINKFKNMYNNADQQPILIGTDSINNLNTSIGITATTTQENIAVFPTLSMDGKVYVNANYANTLTKIEVIDADGRILNTIYNSGFQSEFIVNLPFTKGVYYLRLTSKNKVSYKKVVKI
jgi:hypothetical protein